ncbi:hypothetical protein pdam_00007477 [Pocillopora damicornis]|uniref:Uncharacterized protein n=1 Tax=Pocillopora damicornis TaxID=46731 RepID=A0A3M6TGU2_POCDA|nr:hypothetical protein pdam_00007477 [Pocillopora damicornis]
MMISTTFGRPGINYSLK